MGRRKTIREGVVRNPAAPRTAEECIEQRENNISRILIRFIGKSNFDNSVARPC